MPTNTKWEVFLPATDTGRLNKSVTVAADNWMDALKTGLGTLGQRTPAGHDLLVDIKGPVVHVTDVQSRRVFELRPVSEGTSAPRQEPSAPGEEKGNNGVSAAGPPKPSEPPAKGLRPKSKPALVSHQVFFVRDEDPGPQNRLTYRERLIAVAPGTSDEAAEALLRDYCERILATIADQPRGKFINLAVFDHSFDQRAERPALAALDWKDWRGPQPVVSFPLEAPAVVETSHLPGLVQGGKPPAPALAAPAVAPEVVGDTASATTTTNDSATGPRAVQTSPDQEASSVASAATSGSSATRSRPAKNRKVAARPSQPEADQVAARPSQPEAAPAPRSSATGEGRPSSPAEDLGIGRQSPPPPDLNELLVEVFESMQELYTKKTRLEAITYAIELLAQKIPCEAIAGMVKPEEDTDEMVCVATHGPRAEPLLHQPFALPGTLLGLAVQQGVAVAVSDVGTDPRVSAEVEHLVDGDTRSVLCVPFTFEGQTFGGAEMINRDGGNTWRQGEIHIVSYVGNHLAEYIAQSLPTSVSFSDLDFEEPSRAKVRASARPASVPSGGSSGPGKGISRKGRAGGAKAGAKAKSSPKEKSAATKGKQGKKKK